MSTVLEKRPMSPWAKVRQRGILRSAVKYFRDHIYRRERAFVMGGPIDDRFSKQRDKGNLSATLVVPTNADDIPPLAGWLEHRRAQFQDMIAAGHYGTFALVDGRAIGCVWVSRKDFRDPNSGLFVKVPPNTAYFFGLLVDHNHRDTDIAWSLANDTLASMREEGCDRAFSHCDIANEISYRVHHALGFPETGLLVIEHILLGWNIQRDSRYEGEIAPEHWRIRRRRK